MAEPHVRTEVHPGPDGPVVVRTALDDAGRASLAREAERLDRARHPGVVELRAATDDQLTLGWAGGETLATARPTVDGAAALLASVAATVADLHELGIVHGRLEPSHVIVGADGHPRLCGLRGRGPDEPTTGPADDVAALGGLVDHLLGAETDVEPIPDRRWRRRRWSGYRRRVLLTIADRAADPDPARRPTARELARAIAEAVPEATLPTAPPRPVAPAARPAAPPAASPSRPTASPPPLPRRVPSAAPAPPRATATPADPPAPKVRAAPPTDPPRPTEPRRPAAPPARRSAPARAAVLRVSAAAGIVALVLAATAWLRPDAPGPGPAPAVPSGSGSVVVAARPTTSSTTAPSPCSPVDGATDDLDGDGCPDLYLVDGTTVRALGRTFEVGRSGDHVQVGDWDCDGSASAAVVRPSTGEVFVFDSWDLSGAPVTVRATDVVAGARSLRPDPGPACVPVVRGEDGTRTPLDLGGVGP